MTIPRVEMVKSQGLRAAESTFDKRPPKGIKGPVVLFDSRTSFGKVMGKSLVQIGDCGHVCDE